MPEHYELVCLFERQRPQQDGFDDREERCIRTDSQREGDDRGRGKSRLAPEEPQRLAHIVGQHGWLRR